MVNSNLTPRKLCEQLEHFKNIDIIETIKKIIFCQLNMI